MSSDFGRGLRSGDNGAPDAAYCADDGQRLCGEREVQRGQDPHAGRPQNQHDSDAIAGSQRLLRNTILNLLILSYRIMTFHSGSN